MNDKMIESLFPCPFCGGKARFANKNGHWIICNECGTGTNYYTESEDAIAAWNQRKPIERILERLEGEAEEQHKLFAIAFNPEDRGGFDAYSNAIEIVKEEGGLND